ncbi:response regulator transcription factor [Thalassovita taeanensis]|uniref:Two-component system, OmpR family, response regulator n=1 Tax=Thalassovita taeanensis TaxID=657014 RepID=A0A1H9AGH9_9RHOB|nr:response regulator transcription factor [Thalassovita taeanensis]SEP75844.1 two-component system, OmpR family, response regulator [Thalassovita taeanensis]
MTHAIAPCILIVEDDPDTAEAMAQAACDVGADPVVRCSYAGGLAAAAGAEFAVIMFDRMLPGGDGVDAIAKLRAAGSTALVMVVSALGRAANKIEGLEKGADDYLAKPFDPDELRARLRALLRRKAMVALDNDVMVFGDLEIRLKARTVHIGQAHVALSPKEFELITYFARNAGETVTRMQLLEHVWNLHFDPQTNVVDVHVGRLRRKLEAVAGRAVIHTARGQGYVFDPQREGAA